MTNDFIGRRDDLNTICKKLHGKSNLLCITGEGGIGKTRILSQIEEACQHDIHWLFLPIFDFDDYRFHYIENIPIEIANKLGREHFSGYFEQLEQLHFMEKHRASVEYLAQQSQFINDEFVKEFNIAILNQGIEKAVIRFDTTDNLHGVLGPLSFIAWLTKNLLNTFIIIVGRDSAKILNELGVLSSAEKEEMTYQLMPLPFSDCVDYVYIKSRSLSLDSTLLDEELLKRMVLLSRGKIILLDITLNWIWQNNNILPKWLQQPIKEGDESVYDDFEIQVFSYLKEGRDRLDSLILLMSKVYPLDEASIKDLHNYSDAETKELKDAAQSLSFVKSIPGGFIKLHDEAERIINTHIWETLPQNWLEFTRKKAVKYLHNKSTSFIQNIRENAISATNYPMFGFISQQLHHLLQLDLTEGYDVFKDYWSIAERELQSIAFQRALLDEITPYIGELEMRGSFDVTLSQANRLIRDGDPQRAIEDYLNPLLSGKYTLESTTLTSSLLLKATAEFKLGNFDESFSSLNKIVDVSVKESNNPLIVKTKLMLGNLMTLNGRLTDAIHNYLSSLDFAIRGVDDESIGVLLSWMAYTQSLLGNDKSALHHIEQAILFYSPSKLAGDSLRITMGQSFWLIGLSLLEIGFPQRALEYFQIAGEQLTPLGLQEWKENLALGRSDSYLAMGKIEDAYTEIKPISTSQHRSIQYKVQLSLANIEWLRGNHKETVNLLIQSFEGVKSYQDVLYKLRILCLLSLAAFYNDNLEMSTLDEIAIEYEKIVKQHGETEHFYFDGIVLTQLGHLAIKNGKIALAIEYYQRGMPKLARSAEFHAYETYNLSRQLRFMSDKVLKLIPLQDVRKLGKEFLQFWKDNDLEVLCSEAVLFFHNWENS